MARLLGLARNPSRFRFFIFTPENIDTEGYGIYKRRTQKEVIVVPSLDKKEVRKGHVVSLDKQVPAVVGRLDSTGVFQKGVVVKIGGFYDELPCLVTARVVCAECIPEESERYSVRVLLAPVRNGEYDPNGPHYQVILKDRTHLRFRLHLQPDQQKPVVSKQRLEETRPIP